MLFITQTFYDQISSLLFEVGIQVGVAKQGGGGLG